MKEYSLADWYKELAAEADDEAPRGIAQKLRKGLGPKSWGYDLHNFGSQNSEEHDTLYDRSSIVSASIKNYVQTETALISAEFEWDAQRIRRYEGYLQEVPERSRQRIMAVLAHYMPHICHPRRIIFAEDLELFGLGDDLQNWFVENVGSHVAHRQGLAGRNYVHALVKCCYDTEISFAEALKVFSLIQAYQPYGVWQRYNEPPPPTWCAAIREWGLAGRRVEPLEYEELIQGAEPFLSLWLAVPEVASAVEPDVLQQWADQFLKEQYAHFVRSSGSVEGHADGFAALGLVLQAIPDSVVQHLITTGVKHRGDGLRKIAANVKGFNQSLLASLAWEEPTNIAGVVDWLGELGVTGAETDLHEAIDAADNLQIRSSLSGVLWRHDPNLVPWRSRSALEDYVSAGFCEEFSLPWVQWRELPALSWAESLDEVPAHISMWLVQHFACASFQPAGAETQLLPQLFCPKTYASFTAELMRQWVDFDTLVAPNRPAITTKVATSNKAWCPSDATPVDCLGVLTLAALSSSRDSSNHVVAYLCKNSRNVAQCRAMIAVLAYDASDEAVRIVHELSVAHPATWICREAEKHLKSIAESRNILLDDLLDMFPPHFEWFPSVASDVPETSWSSGRPWAHDPCFQAICGSHVTAEHVGKVWQVLVSGFLDRCRRAVRADHRWGADEWTQRYTQEPLMAHLSSTVVWVAVDSQGGRQVFRVGSDNVCRDRSGSLVDISGKDVMVLDPICQQAEQCAATELPPGKPAAAGESVSVDAGAGGFRSDGHKATVSLYGAGQEIDLYDFQTAVERLGYHKVEQDGCVSEWALLCQRSKLRFVLQHSLTRLPLRRHAVFFGGFYVSDSDGNPVELSTMSPAVLASVRCDIDKVLDAAAPTPTTSRRDTPQQSPHEVCVLESKLLLSQRVYRNPRERHGLPARSGVSDTVQETLGNWYTQACHDMERAPVVDLDVELDSGRFLDSTDDYFGDLGWVWRDFLFTNGVTVLHALRFVIEQWRAQHRQAILPAVEWNKSSQQRYTELLAQTPEPSRDMLLAILSEYLPSEDSAVSVVARHDRGLVGAAPTDGRLWMLEQVATMRWKLAQVLPESPVSMLLGHCADADVSVVEAAKLVRLVNVYHVNQGVMGLDTRMTARELCFSHWKASGRKLPRAKFTKLLD